MTTLQQLTSVDNRDHSPDYEIVVMDIDGAVTLATT